MKSTAISHETIQKKTTLLRKPAVLARVPVSDTTLWRRVRDGSFPSPVRISKNAVAWRSTDIDEWIANQK